MSVTVQMKNYEHWNRSFPEWDHPTKGRWVRNQRHYQELCQRYNMIPFDMANDLAEKRQGKLAGKRYEPTPEIRAFLQYVQDKTDKRTGKVKLDDNAVNFMIEHGIVQDMDIVERQLKQCGVEDVPSY